MPDHAEIEKAIKLLRLGEVVGIPTETVYGLAARIDYPTAVEKIFSTKERPFFDPLIVHVSSVEQAKSLTSFWGPVADALAKAFWPGPLTLVLPKSDLVNSMITSGLESVGIRMPKHSMTLEVIESLGVPLAAPSANKFGRTSPTSAEHVWQEFKNENVFVLDGGPCDIGIESTVLLVKENQNEPQISVLRRGHVLISDIEIVLRNADLKVEVLEAVSKKESPGHMKHHYMPAVPLIIAKKEHGNGAELLKIVNQRLQELPDSIEGVKIIKPEHGIESYQILNLSEDPVIASRELYSELRRIGESGTECILFYQESHQVGPYWENLFDRLNKAASLIL